MKKIIGILSIAGILMTGCSSEPVATTQHECLEQGKFKWEDHCVKYEDIPKEDQEQVWSEVADEIAKANGISKTEAMKMILDKLDEYQK